MRWTDAVNDLSMAKGISDKNAGEMISDQTQWRPFMNEGGCVNGEVCFAWWNNYV